MSTVAFHTLGCKVNFYDTEAIWRLFQAADYSQVAFEEQADVYVINTCTVTNTGDKKSRQAIRKAVRTNPDAVVVVTGCYAQIAPREVAAIAGVDLVIGNDGRTRIVELVEQVRREQHPFQSVGDILKTREFEEMDVPVFVDRRRANLKIQDGCNNFCTFCIIPYARGLIRSRNPANIVAQARKLTAAGHREIVLTGIHTGGYGEDLDGYRLSHLLRDLEAVEGLQRIRISSIEASEIDDDLIRVLGSSQKVCRHLHIPLQAGNNEVLRRMNRHYTVQAYADKLARLREAMPHLAVTTDIIVGFPGETDPFFADTEKFVSEQRFAQLHVFPYSPRTGTPAAKFSDRVPEDVKEDRVHRLIELGKWLAKEYASTFDNRVLEVIPEDLLQLDGMLPGHGPDGASGTWWVGHAENYLKVAFRVPDALAGEQLHGEIVRIRMTESGSEVQFGEFVEQVTFADASDEPDANRASLG